MQVGVIDSANYVNNPKIKMLTFPNYSDPAFTEKWKKMGDSVAFPVEELPSEGKVYNFHVLTCAIHTREIPTWMYGVSKMKLFEHSQFSHVFFIFHSSAI